MTVWFTSDLHLHHEKVATERGFSTVARHDMSIIESIERTVDRGDQVWILGDLTVGGTAAETYALETLKHYIADLCGAELHLIAGNHDSCHPMANRNSHNRQRAFLETFTSVQLFARRRIAGQPVLLSHFPYVGDHSETDRGVQYRLPDNGEYVLHGHTHSKAVGTGKQIHVGWDAWRGLVDLDEIAALIDDNQAQQ